MLSAGHSRAWPQRGFAKHLVEGQTYAACRGAARLPAEPVDLALRPDGGRAAVMLSADHARAWPQRTFAKDLVEGKRMRRAVGRRDYRASW